MLAPKLAAMMLLGIPLIVVPIDLLGRRVRAISTHSQDRIADVGTVTGEVLGAMKIVQAFNQQGREAERFTDADRNRVHHRQAPHRAARADDLRSSSP